MSFQNEYNCHMSKKRKQSLTKGEGHLAGPEGQAVHLARRAFLGGAGALVARGALTARLPLLSSAILGISCSPAGAAAESEKRPTRSARKRASRGALITCMQDAKAFKSGEHVATRVREMVLRTVAAAVDVKKPDEAFRALFQPRDIVAIKVNCLAGPGLSSSPSVVDALVSGLRSIGIPYKNIYIWERTTVELRKAGFVINHHSDSRPRCYGNDEGGFESRLEFSGEVGSLWSNILAKRATALINVPVLKDHDLSGVGCGMKNMYGAIHNPNRYHDNNCDPYVADVSAHRYVKDKLKLVVADALTAQYHGGPAKVATHQWRPAKLFASTDPVALDR